MGSRDEFFAAVAFVDKHKIHPVVDSVLEGLEHAEDGFQLLKQGGQFGKVRFGVLEPLCSRGRSRSRRADTLGSRRSSSTLLGTSLPSCRWVCVVHPQDRTVSVPRRAGETWVREAKSGGLRQGGCEHGTVARLAEERATCACLRTTEEEEKSKREARGQHSFLRSER